MIEVYVEKKKTNESIQMISVAEAGDNYIRFSNGLQICFDCLASSSKNENIGNYNKGTITYPKPFISQPALSVSRYLNDAYKPTSYEKAIHYGSLNETSFMIIGEDDADPASVINFSYIAIGKWK